MIDNMGPSTWYSMSSWNGYGYRASVVAELVSLKTA